MSGKSYGGALNRTFAAALQHLLERNYGLIGSRRVIKMIAADVTALIEQFYPLPERVPPGWMLYTGTKATGPKASPSRTADEYELVTVAWPVVVPEDIETLVDLPSGKAAKQAREALLKRRLVRLVTYGWEHPQGPVLLTLADLSLMLGGDTTQMSKLLTTARAETGLELLTKGYYFDQGRMPTHKDQVVALYEQGVDEAQIARLTNHAQDSVGHYIRGYERVLLLARRHFPAPEIAAATGMSNGLVKVYLGLIARYHPDLVDEETQEVTVSA